MGAPVRENGFRLPSPRIRQEKDRGCIWDGVPDFRGLDVCVALGMPPLETLLGPFILLCRQRVNPLE